MTRPRMTIAVAAALSASLVVVYAALGRGSEPTPVVFDPCAERAWRTPSGIEETLEQVVLSTADGVACDLAVSREELVLALGGQTDLDAFADRHDISRGEAEDAVREGLLRAVDDAERAEAISPTLAGFLRGAAERLPMSLLLSILSGASGLLPG